MSYVETGSPYQFQNSVVSYFYYRSQRSCGKVMFLHLSVILSTEGVPGRPPQADPPGQTPPGQTPRAGTPWQTPPPRHPPGQTPHPPREDTPSPADGYCSTLISLLFHYKRLSITSKCQLSPERIVLDLESQCDPQKASGIRPAVA